MDKASDQSIADPVFNEEKYLAVVIKIVQDQGIDTERVETSRDTKQWMFT